MLETVVAEKMLPTSRPPSSPAVPATPSVARSSTLSANQRLRGLLSRGASTPQSSAPPREAPLPPVPSTSDGQASAEPPALTPLERGSSSSGLYQVGNAGSVGSSSISLASSAPPEENKSSTSSGGFRQVVVQSPSSTGLSSLRTTSSLAAAPNDQSSSGTASSPTPPPTMESGS